MKKKSEKLTKRRSPTIKTLKIDSELIWKRFGINFEIKLNPTSQRCRGEEPQSTTQVQQSLKMNLRTKHARKQKIASTRRASTMMKRYTRSKSPTRAKIKSKRPRDID